MSDTRARGSDVSHHQNPAALRWAEWRALGLCFVFIRASHGTARDATYLDHRARARAAGFLTGSYHYIYAVGDPVLQARKYAEVLEPDELGAMADIEDHALTLAKVRAFLAEFCRLRPDVPINAYTSAPRWLAIVGNAAGDLDLEDLWIAGYPFDRPDYTPAGVYQGQLMDAASVARRSTPPTDRNPAIPGAWPAWDIWQHTGHGRLPGYGKDLDLNVYAGTEAELRARYDPAYAPPIQEIPPMTTRCKLGPHHLAGGQLTEAWKALGVPVAKYVDDFGPHEPPPAGTTLLGRVVGDWWEGTFDPNQLYQWMTPEWAASEYIAHLAEKYRLNPHILLWEGPNEIHPENDTAFLWYSNFLYHYAAQMKARGLRAAIGGWAVGTPEIDRWHLYVPALRAVADHGAILTRHEYGPLDGFHSLRYRRDQAEFTKLGYPNMPLIISEAGADRVAGQSAFREPYWGGDMGKYWGELLKPYADALAADDYVLGACVFTTGQSGGWQEFNVDGTDIVQRVRDYVAPAVVVPPVVSLPIRLLENNMKRWVLTTSDKVTMGQLRNALGVDFIELQIAIPVDDTPPPTPTGLHALNNQAAFNLFSKAFGSAGYWVILTRAVGLAHANAMAAARTAAYTGPSIAAMSALTQAERDKLAAAL